MAIIESTTAVKTWVGEYDFAVDGGVVGTITLRGVGAAAGPIPNGAVVYDGYLEVLTLVTSGGAATGALQVEAANDTVNAAVVSGTPWSTTGVKSLIEAGAGANAVKTTAARSPAFVIGAANLTAGKFRLVLTYR